MSCWLAASSLGHGHCRLALTIVCLFFKCSGAKLRDIKLKSSDIKVEIYDNRPDSKEIPDNIHYSGYVDEISLLSRLHEGGFGLIWSEDEYIKNYMHYCNSYKVSTYLRAGIPIVVFLVLIW